ncbi:MAG: hypothetical protein EXX96DRAFT_581052 [Benjaminiella poitrasii]|nr:MAG: hypothetical protein EXX96DRAFT_581052 [Benjaminiella poitrasii]
MQKCHFSSIFIYIFLTLYIMCGRFCCSLDPTTIRTRLHDEYHVDQKTGMEWKDEDRYRASYNVCPTRWIPAMYEMSDSSKTKTMQSMQWGFIPSWMTTTPYTKPINARSETLLTENSLFDRSKSTNRCIIIAEGFYEWKTKRQPFYVRRKDGRLMLFAGLFSTCHLVGTRTTTCTIITTSSESIAFSKIHHRIPVILKDADQVNRWLDPTTSWSPLVFEHLLSAFEGELEWHQVTERIGSIKSDSPELIQPLDQTKGSISYFLQKSQQQREDKVTIKKEEEGKQPMEDDGKRKEKQPQLKQQQPQLKQQQSVVNNHGKIKKKRKSSKDLSSSSTAPKITQFFSKQ